MSQTRYNLRRRSSAATLTPPATTSSAATDASESGVRSKKEQLLKILESHDSSFLIEESYKVFKAKLRQMYEESEKEFNKSLPQLPEEEYLTIENKDSSYEDGFSMFLTYLLIVLVSLMGFYGKCIYDSLMLSEEVRDVMKFCSPYVCCLMVYLFYLKMK